MVVRASMTHESPSSVLIDVKSTAGFTTSLPGNGPWTATCCALALGLTVNNQFFISQYCRKQSKGGMLRETYRASNLSIDPGAVSGKPTHWQASMLQTITPRQ
jgi:hypothetical protein